MAWIQLKSTTASGAAAVEFTTGIDDTYRLYRFSFSNINPATDSASFQFQANASGESGFNETLNSTFWRVINQEDGGQAAIGYDDSWDVDTTTTYHNLAVDIGNGADEAAAGELFIYEPSDTTYNTFWDARLIACSQPAGAEMDARDYYSGGYFKTAAAITEFNFKMSSGNFDGTIELWGLEQ